MQRFDVLDFGCYRGLRAFLLRACLLGLGALRSFGSRCVTVLQIVQRWLGKLSEGSGLDGLDARRG